MVHDPQSIRLLDIDPDLGAKLSDEERELVHRYVVLPAVTLPRGAFDPRDFDATPAVEGEVLGFLIASGIAAMDVSVLGRSCTRILIPNELILLHGSDSDSIASHWGWRAIEETTIALLDDRLLVFGRRWPGLMKAILRCAAHQSRHALLQQAVSQLPRIQDRLLALMWSIADRQGIVREDGVWIHVPVTHDVLAHMVGARRPTVSLGLKSLIEAGVITPRIDGWILDPASHAPFPGPDPGLD